MTENNRSVRRLDAEFEKSGRKFKKVYEDDKWYVYAVWTGTRQTPMYEMFKRLTKPVEVRTDSGKWVKVDGKFYEPYPNDNAFGIGAPFYAFDCISMERCKDRMFKVNEYEAGRRVNWH